MANKIDPLIRLTADNSGETKCVVLATDYDEAKRGLKPYVSRIVKHFPFISGFGALVHVHRLEDIVRLPFVKAISAHTTVHAALNRSRGRIGAEKLFLEGMYGAGVTAAVIDTGVSPHLDFCLPRYRIRAFEDFVDGAPTAYDDNGHGSAVASILLGNGLRSAGLYRGIAPKTELVALKAMDGNGEGSAFHILEAMQWIYLHRETHNIRVACMSFGTAPLPDEDPLILGAEVLWNSGITVVASAGNAGPAGRTITSPGASPRVITVGGAGFTDGKPYVAKFSSRGPVNELNKPDLVAPAVDISCCDPFGDYTVLSGTSMSTPIVAGLAAQVLSKKPGYTPDRVKEVLTGAVKKLDFPPNECGCGLVDCGELLKKLKP
ncbi:MAG: S8 family peptidase [Clostridiales bacterium]|jgi:serine protease AprX|nr:S8 family peptidase [Clostridiales bacterium]